MVEMVYAGTEGERIREKERGEERKRTGEIELENEMG